MKRMATNFGLAIAAIVVLLLVLEGVLRVTHLFGARLSWTEPDSSIGWRFTANRGYWHFKENGHAITGRINSLGWRDFERTRGKPEGAYRVVVMGDSYVEAFQVELESTFVAIAERDLNDRFERPVEVMNLGRSGMTQIEELIVLERDVLALEPDLIVLVFVPRNDIADVNPQTADELTRPFARASATGELQFDSSFVESSRFRMQRRINAFKQHSALMSLLAERYNAWRLSRRRAAVVPESAEKDLSLSGAFSLCTQSPDSLYVAGYQLCKRLMSQMAGSAAGRDAQLLLMSVPLVYRGEDTARYRDLDATFDPGYFDRDLAAMADSMEGIGFLPLQAAFERRYQETGKPLYWAHWNYAGHRLAGELLADRAAEELK